MAEYLIEMGRARCKKGEILRKGFQRKDGVRVKATCVPDTGLPGKTPASRRFLPEMGPNPLGGWKKGMPAGERHSRLRKQVDQKGCRRVIQDLNALANTTTDRPTETKMRQDAKWLHNQGFCKLKTKR
jgi:hypothetical protein